MASIRREAIIDVSAAQVWDALRDIGALPTRLAKGFVTECRLEDDDTRLVTFANGMVVREPIIDIGDTDRRLVWSAIGGRLTHYNASAQVFDDGPSRCRVVWIADLLPHAMAPAISGMIEQGLAAMKATLEAAAKA